MNGQGQTAGALLRKDLRTTLDAALKSDDNLRAEFGTLLEDIKKELRNEFIESISAEGQARMVVAHELKMLRGHYVAFRRLSWWGRVKWALFKGYGI